MNKSVLPAIMAVITCFGLWTSPVSAQQNGDQRVGDPEATKSPDQILADAISAHEAGDHQRALDLLDLAAFKDPQPRIVYQRIVVLEAMQQEDRALAVLEKHRKELAGQPGVGDLTALEQRLREASMSTNDDNLTDRARDDKPEESDYIGWTLIGSGAVAVGGGVTLLLLAENELDEVRCSAMYPQSERQNCAGVDAPTQISRAEFDQRLERVDSYRLIGGSLLTLGVLAAGYGSYRLFSAESRPTDGEPAGGREDDPMAWRAAPRLEGGLEIQAVWRF